MILTVGDSVCWGQGLLEEHKFDAIFAGMKGLPYVRVAHSGAVIGSSTDSSTESVNGEVPIASPSDWQQVLEPRDWAEVDIVLLNGGINDVGLSRILSPWTNTNQLEQWIDQFCHQSMQQLLQATAAKLTKPGAKIAVVGYYPILSEQSGFPSDDHFRMLLELNGIATSSVALRSTLSTKDTAPSVVANCLSFWKNSNVMLQAAVDGANQELNGDTCVFVKLPFTEENAMWAPQSLLWELSALLEPEDEVAGARSAVCEKIYGDVVHIPQWIQCVRASTGHPDVAGAARIAQALNSVL
jgi:lysophospholipase L1-like esterase